MLVRAKRNGIRFTHVMADCWFGNRNNIEAVVSLKLKGIFRMKRGNLQYRYNNKDYTATELYAFFKRRMKQLYSLSNSSAECATEPVR